MVEESRAVSVGKVLVQNNKLELELRLIENHPRILERIRRSDLNIRNARFEPELHEFLKILVVFDYECVNRHESN